MQSEQIELIPNADATEVEVRIKLDLRREPFAAAHRQSEAAQAELKQHVAKMTLREQQLNTQLDDLSQRLGRAQAELKGREQTFDQLKVQYALRQLELEERCFLLIEQQRELLDTIEAAEQRMQAGTKSPAYTGAPMPAFGAAQTNVASPLPQTFSAARTDVTTAQFVAPVQPSAPMMPATQTIAGPTDVAVPDVQLIHDTPAPRDERSSAMAILDAPAVDMTTPRTTWTRNPTLDYGDEAVSFGFGHGVGRFVNRVQIFLGFTPGFAQIDGDALGNAYTDWDDVPDDRDDELLHLVRPWYKRPLALFTLLLITCGVGLALVGPELVGSKIEQTFSSAGNVTPSYLVIDERIE